MRALKPQRSGLVVSANLAGALPCVQHASALMGRPADPAPRPVQVVAALARYGFIEA
jgi:hypothetical protein